MTSSALKVVIIRGTTRPGVRIYRVGDEIRIYYGDERFHVDVKDGEIVVKPKEVE